MLAVAGGLGRHVLCFRTVWEATFTELMKQGKIVPSGGGRADWLAVPFGATSAAHTLAHERATPLPPLRHHQGDAGLDRAEPARQRRAQPDRDLPRPDDDGRLPAARPITTPFGLYDCDVPCDGVDRRHRLRRRRRRRPGQAAGRVEAVGTQIIERVDWDQGTLTHEPQVLGQAAHLWTRTSLRPADVDVAQLYDGFTFNCLSWIEALGFCGIGEAKDFLDGGKNIALDGVTAAEHARRPALARPHPRDGPAPRGGHPAARRGRRTPGRRRPGRRGQQRRAHAQRRAAAAGGHMTAKEPASPRPRSSRWCIVDGVPMSALVAEAAGSAGGDRCHPRRRHHRRSTSTARAIPRLSLAADRRGGRFTVVALDRPGYGSSAPYPEAMAAPEQRVDLAYGAVDRILGQRPRGAGVFVMGHSGGCELAMRMAADERRRRSARHRTGGHRAALSSRGPRNPEDGDARTHAGGPARTAVASRAAVSARGAQRGHGLAGRPGL